ncbi:iron complex transport system permease protein [Alkalithermobacter thermoalcaliphilus JW-YL-7 = DSM 7308]|uniref:ABC-type transporter, integral membrane subunit n=1 Tax=Alkalithermobacter thermoalcaliphilus JW-YL-7 = DSM 7308 TaxID=1121328 RepID=A0A150FSV0_CLOPD|nr:ABC-type transporter, integral membrane subunit [[Clostridium] paradoxum JW-YL-7 = DSM 7308]SHL17781.1 iron complex transport system permease protein [[Clostridium] paradoxum JW-YL-7 = DSM 7308]
MKLKYILIILSPIPIMAASLMVGPYSLSFKDILLLFQGKLLDNQAHIILFQVRLPRILLAFLSGMAFSASGAAFQAIFHNPLVDSYILGLGSGAAFGAALAITYLNIPAQIGAFIFALLAVVLAYFVSNKGSLVSLILSGMMISSVFTAMLSIIQIFADPLKVQSIVYWMMGSLHTANWEKIYSSLPFMIIGVFILINKRWKLNILSLGDRESKSLGLDYKKEKIIVIIAATMLASSAVSVSGIIGLVGLMIPHIIRMIIGPDNRLVIPLAISFGGAFLVLVDTISRNIASYEIPIGIFTTILGAPFFIYLLRKTKLGGWQ